MIFHVSLEAKSPKRVAEVIAELWEGKALPLDRLVQGSWIAYCGDSHLSAIEIFPQGTNITESEGDAPWVGIHKGEFRPTATHVALGTNLERKRIFEIAEREGWRAKFVMRGDRFGVIEMWLNDHFVIEWLTPEMQVPYDKTVKQMLQDLRN